MNVTEQANAAAMPLRNARRSTPAILLERAGEFWFIVTITGQWLFASYVTLFYGRAVVAGNPEAWNKVLPHGYVAGDLAGNLLVATHLLMAVVIIVGGPLQIISGVRARFPVAHRWAGRTYMVTAFLISVSGMIMVFTRGTVGGVSQLISINLNAVLILIFAALALKSARTGKISSHRRWALRLFLAVSGVWFFRVGLMLWLMIHKRPVGFDPDSFTGPFLTVLGFGQYIIPLLVLEGYFLARRHPREAIKIAMSIVIFVLTVLMAGGIFAAAMGMWLPRL